MLFGLDCADVESGKKTNWAAAKAQGPISFAILRASFGTAPDVSFQASWAASKAVGLTRGAYLFLRFPRKGTAAPPDPELQAAAFCKIVGALGPGDLPPTIDLEFPGNGIADTGMTARQALDWLRAAWKIVVASYGVPPILYTSARVWHEDLGDIAAPDLVDSPLWLARYFYASNTTAVRDSGALGSGHMDPPTPPPWGDANWWIHQYQGDAIGMPGFAATVDMDRFNAMLKGATGGRVAWVQRKLGVAETGVFDAALNSKVIAFQRTSGLADDGIIGPRTFAALCWARAAATRPRPMAGASSVRAAAAALSR
jgi:GH25 family lysozyme M1 (1,4-beta-N-acetylmuramidase)